MFKLEKFRTFKIGNIVLYHPSDINPLADLCGGDHNGQHCKKSFAIKIKYVKHSFHFNCMLLIIISLLFFLPLWYVIRYFIYNSFSSFSFTYDNFNLYLPLCLLLFFLPTTIVNIAGYINDMAAVKWLILTDEELICSFVSPFLINWQNKMPSTQVFKKDNINSILINTEFDDEALFDFLKWRPSYYGLKKRILNIKSKRPYMEISESRKQALLQEFSTLRVEEYLYIRTIDIGNVYFNSLQFIINILSVSLPVGTEIVVDQEHQL